MSEQKLEQGVQYKLTFDDYKTAFRLHYRLPRLVTLCIFLLAGVLIFGFVSWKNEVMLIAAIVLLELPLFYAVFPYVVAWRFYKKTPLADMNVFIALRSDGVSTATERSSMHYLWKDFTHWKDNDRTLLIYVSPSMFLTLPSCLENLGFPLDELKTHLRRELGPPKR